MIADGWLHASRVLTGAAVAGVEELVRLVAGALAEAARVPPGRVEDAFLPLIAGEGFSIGNGVAIPHTEMDGLAETVVCLVTVREPLPLPTVDGRPPDVFLFILSRPDPHGHLLLLAHVARLTQSRTFVEGLRRARSGEEVVALVRAAELRHSRAHTVPPSPAAAAEALVMISVSGEKLVDDLLVALVDHGFDDACLLEAQSLRDAAAREVPLFAGFRDLFGDPGGRRVLLIETTASGATDLVGAVRRICEEHRSRDARVSVLPIELQWRASAPEPVESGGGH